VKQVPAMLGNALLYRLEEPIYYEDCDEDFIMLVEKSTRYVIVAPREYFSFVPGLAMKETLVFPADSNGNVLCWTEICQVKNSLSHEVALNVINCTMLGNPPGCIVTKQ